MCCRIISLSAVCLPHCVLLVRISAQHGVTRKQHRAWDSRSPAQRYSLGLWEQVQLVQATLCKAAGMVRISTLKSHSSILPNSIRFNVLTEISVGGVVARFFLNERRTNNITESFSLSGAFID